MARRTLAGTATVSGTGLHTGAKTTVQVGPGEAGSGIRFQRTDLPGQPLVAARVAQVEATERRTGLADGGAALVMTTAVLSIIAPGFAWAEHIRRRSARGRSGQRAHRCRPALWSDLARSMIGGG